MFDWSASRHTWLSCSRCSALCSGKVVLGNGDSKASLMFIADMPSEQDAASGEPFTDNVRPYFTETLEKCGLDMRDVWVTYCVACSPPDKREPYKPELANCLDRLHEEILMVDPDVIVLLDRLPVQHLLGVKEPIGRLQLRTFLLRVRDAEYFTIVSYGPRHIMRNPSQKKGQPWHVMYRAFSRAKQVSDTLRRLRNE